MMHVLLQAGGVADDTGSALVLVFVFIIAAILSLVAGYYVGSIAGRTERGDLGSAAALARQQVDASSARLRNLSGRLVGLDKVGRHAGDTLVLATRLNGVANDLGGLEQRASRRARGGVE